MKMKRLLVHFAASLMAALLTFDSSVVDAQSASPKAPIQKAAKKTEKPVRQSLKPGTAFRDCKACPIMVVVPSGLYIMGLGATTKTAKPPRRVNITRPFAIGRYEITFDQWLVCAADKACPYDPNRHHDHNWGKGSRPMINITWDEAIIYTKWLSKKTGRHYRLPSEAEWEYVHRAGTTTRFWWGDEVGNKNANCRDCESRSCCSAKDHSCCSHGTVPVGTFKPNAFGVHDTAGNVFEWVADCWNRDHRDAPSDGSVRTEGDCRNRVIRGGSFYYFNKVSRSFYRAKNPPGVKSYWLGFRVLREMTPPKKKPAN